MKVSEIRLGERYVVWRWVRALKSCGFPGVRAHFTAEAVDRDGRKVVVAYDYIPALSRDMETLKVTWGPMTQAKISLYPYSFVRRV